MTKRTKRLIPSVVGLLLCIGLALFAFHDNKKELFLVAMGLFSFYMFILWMDTQPNV